MKKQPKLEEIAYAVKVGDTFALSSVTISRQSAREWKKTGMWKNGKIVKVKIIEQ